MTISVASIFPPESLAGFSYGNSVPLESGIVFCTDSRLTYTPGGPRDHGNKVFQIAPGIGLVFTGSVSVAHFTLDRLTQMFRGRATDLRVPQIISRISRTFRKGYSLIKGRAPLNHRRLLHTEYLVGIYRSGSSRSVVAHFSAPQFLPVFKTTVSAIGSTEAVRQAFMVRLADRVRSNGYLPESPFYMSTLLLSVVQDTIDSGEDKGIGGVPQGVYIDSNGMRTLGHVILDEEGTPEYRVEREGEGWVKKSPEGTQMSKTDFPPYDA